MLDFLMTRVHAAAYMTATQWHRRLGHASKGVMERIHRENRARHLDYAPGLVDCEECRIAKAKRLTPVRRELNSNRKFGETLSLDIDEFPVQSIEGYKYRLDIIDHATSWIWSVGLIRKNDFEAGLKWVLNEVKDTIKEIRADGAREFHGQVMKDLAMTYRFNLKRTNRYVHEQAGKVERIHQTIDGAVRTVLKQSGLPSSYWYMASEYVHSTIEKYTSICCKQRGESIRS
jgi:DNA-directed RNA polymerase beta' subunit